ncbi:MAG: histidine ammonia-lyase [Planctomycetota bacterium]|nr:MAG: histidine ammonia-lyase [Planctomycetota bacterium]
MRTVSLGERLDRDTLLAAARGERLKLRFGAEALERVRRARALVDRIVAGEQAVYGVNTGFGALARERIPAAEVGTLQRNLLLSHAVGVGPDLSAVEKRLALLLRIHSICRGASGVRPEVVRWLIRLFDSGWLPRMPEQGSVGASGDLAPLAHLALPLIGAGELVSPEGRVVPARRALARIGLEPLELAAKEGLALINGVQVSNAVGLAAWARLCNLSATADVAAALSVEALMGSHRPFDPRVVRLRPHRGARAAAANLRRLLRGSQVVKSHAGCGRVQDPYSFRCTPQVHGAARDALHYLERALLLEADSATDNPLVFSDRGDTISAGNFHGQPIALPLDHGALAVTSWANISERRISTLLHPAMNNMLPAFLTPEPGLNSGLMIPQVAAAALASECKVLAHPASADTIPTSADQEDHVSMANHAARKLRQAVGNAERILAIELYTAAQGREFHRELRAGAGAQAAYELLRKHLPPLRGDRYLGPELDKVHELVAAGAVRRAAEEAIGRPLAP